jgi:hypothetical protein
MRTEPNIVANPDSKPTFALLANWSRGIIKAVIGRDKNRTGGDSNIITDLKSPMTVENAPGVH